MNKASTGGICYTSDVVWTVSRAPVLPLPLPAVAGGSVYAAAPTSPGFSISYVPPPPPLQSPSPPPEPPSSPEPQRISRRTHSKTVRFSDTPAVQLQAAPEEPPPTSDQALHHSIGLLSMTNLAELLLMLATRGVIAARRRVTDCWGARATVTFCWGRRGNTVCRRARGTPSALAALFATREDINATLDDQRPPDKLPDLPHCNAS